MTPIFQVVMKHTKEVLYDFIRFNNRVRHPRAKMHMIVLGAGFLVVGYAYKGGLVVKLILMGIGILLWLLLLTRERIAFTKLSLQDEDYEKQTETEYTFGQSGVIVKNPSWDSDIDVKYHEISAVYKDDRNYYLARNNEELYLLPYDCFVMGTAGAFEEFIERKTEKSFKKTKWSIRERIKTMNENRKLKEELHDEMIAKRKKEPEEERSEEK